MIKRRTIFSLKQRLIVASLSFAFSPFASAELFFNPLTQVDEGEISVGAAYTKSTVEYETSGSKFDVERKIVAANAAYGLGDDLGTAFGIGGYITESLFKADGDKSSGEKGSVIGAGYAATLPVDTEYTLKAYGQFAMWNEKYHDKDGAKITGKGNEISVGVIAIKNMDDFDVYAGGEFYLSKTLEGEAKGTNDDGTSDFDRTKGFGLRAGGSYNMDEYTLFGNVGFVHESSFSVGISMKLE
ncbi:MAG TPA: hypothetical protein ENJ28_08905 [Gammaproteobacteria bacterium]|nr:hypothetical protein [Gammaproteobacteria bacterium]